MAAAVVALPIDPYVFMNPTNIQWITALSLILVAAADEPARASHRIFDLLLVLAVGTTGPFIVSLIPVFVTRLLGSRLGGIFVVNLAGALPTIQWIAFGGVVILWLYVVSDAVRRRSWASMAITTAGILVLVAGFAAIENVEPLFRGGGRYLYVPTVTLVWGVVLTRCAKLARNVLLIAAAAVAVSSYQAPPLVDFDWPKASQCVATKPRCIVPINPPGWLLEIRAPEGANRDRGKISVPGRSGAHCSTPTAVHADAAQRRSGAGRDDGHDRVQAVR